MDSFDSVLHAVHCVVSRPVSQRFTRNLVTCVLNWYRRIVDVWFVLHEMTLYSWQHVRIQELIHSCGNFWWWGLFPRLRGFWQNVRPFISCLRFLLLLFFFLKWRLARAHQFQSLCHDQSRVAQRAETTVAECSLTSCVWVRFRIGSHTMPGRRHSQPTPTSLGQGSMPV